MQSCPMPYPLMGHGFPRRNILRRAPALYDILSQSYVPSLAAATMHAFADDYLYLQISFIRRTLVSNKIVDLSDVVVESPVGAAPTTSSFDQRLASIYWAKQLRDETRNIYVLGFGAAYITGLTVCKLHNYSPSQYIKWLSHKSLKVN